MTRKEHRKNNKIPASLECGALYCFSGGASKCRPSLSLYPGPSHGLGGSATIQPVPNTTFQVCGNFCCDLAPVANCQGEGGGGHGHGDIVTPD